MLLLVLVVTVVIWWFGAPHIMRARATLDRVFLTRGHTETLEQRVADLTVSRAETVDHSAAELRRIERDLHDGAQARLVALGMTSAWPRSCSPRTPRPHAKLVTEARDTTGAALADLRAVVRGIHPPVLADRGLAGAVRGARPRHGGARRGDRPPPGDGRPSRSSRRSTSRSPSAWPTSASTPGPSTRGSGCARADGLLARRSATTGPAAPTPTPAPGCAG